jgi:hypothetical protein
VEEEKMKNLIFVFCLMHLVLFLPPPTCGDEKISPPQEIKNLKLEDEGISKEIEDIKCELGKIKSDYDVLKLSVNTAIAESQNSRQYIEDKLLWVHSILALITFVGIGGIITLYKNIKNKIDQEVSKIPQQFKEIRKEMDLEFNRITHEMEKIIKDIDSEVQQIPSKIDDEIKIIANKYDTELSELVKITTRFFDSMARLHHRVAFEEYARWVKAPDKDKDLILRRAIESQRKAQENVQDAYGTDLEKLDDREKYILIEIWQNMAYYLALAKDRNEAAWAIEKVKIAFEWGSGKKALTPPKGITIPIMSFIESYFFVLATFDLAEFQEEWVENYKKWKDFLWEEFSGDPDLMMYESYLEKIKGSKNEGT